MWRRSLGALGVTIFAVALAFLLSLSACSARDTPPIREIQVVQLPPEAQQTLVLIKKGGPFPYTKDGTVFGNRERRLPQHEHGYYREYTVPTPGAKDRGARRIVAGRRAEYYYTDDHYESFRRVRE
jgi:ribonuclease T1